MPAGAIRAKQTARGQDRRVTFRVRDVTLELIYALPGFFPQGDRKEKADRCGADPAWIDPRESGEAEILGLGSASVSR